MEVAQKISVVSAVIRHTIDRVRWGWLEKFRTLRLSFASGLDGAGLKNFGRLGLCSRLNGAIFFQGVIAAILKDRPLLWRANEQI